MKAYQFISYNIVWLLYSNIENMGAAKSVATMYTYNEYLYYYINKKDTNEV